MQDDPDPTTSEAYKLARIRRKAEVLKMEDSLRNNHEYVERYKTTIDSNARVSDTAFWNRVRPIPLTHSENISLHSMDSVALAKRKQSRDSITKKPYNKRPFSTLLAGGRYDADDSNWFTSAGILNIMGLSYNTVYGLIYRSRFSYHHRFRGDDLVHLNFKPGVAFGRKVFVWNTALVFEGAGSLNNTLKLECGSEGFDFNQEGGALTLENSFNTLVFRDNLQKLYKKDYVKLSNEMVPFLGAILTADISASEAFTLQNVSDFSIFFKNQKDFDENIPQNSDFVMERHRDLLFDVLLSWKPTPFYYIKNGRKIARRELNNTPTFFVQFKKAIPVDDLYTDFEVIKTGILQEFNTGLKNTLHYKVEAGKFLNKKKVYFDDFEHFNVQPRVLGGKDVSDVFNLIQYYNYSTTAPYIAANITYQSDFLLLNRLPVIRNRMWREHLTLAWLATQNKGYHLEAGYGLGNMFYDFAVYAGLNNSKKVNWGFRISFPIISRKEISIGM